MDDRAGKTYWEENWKTATIPLLYDLKTRNFKNWVDCAFLSVFDKILCIGTTHNAIEIGCGNSVWLAYLARDRNLEVDGLDYTDIGCETARNILNHYNAQGTVHKGDLFSAPENLRNNYDLVFSNGVAEHFDDTASCIRGCADFAKQGGYILTTVPNMKGIIGVIQKYLDRRIYDVHVPLNIRDLKSAHEKAGLHIIEAGYFVSLNLYVLNDEKYRKHFWYPLLRAAFVLPTKTVWLLEKMGLKIPPSSFLSPYIYVIAKKGQ